MTVILFFWLLLFLLLPSWRNEDEYIASEEVLIQLLKMKCLYSLEVCNLTQRNLQSLDFIVNRFLFNTNSVHNVNLSISFELPSMILPKRLIKFESAIVAR